MRRLGWLALLIGVVITIAACNAPEVRTTRSEVMAEPEAIEVEPTPVPTQEELPMASNYEVLFEAPELHDGVWINAEPMKLADLKGKVVLLEMWTFGCYNCRNVQPWLIEWHNKYHGEDFLIIANHYPEFNYEADLGNLQQAVIDQGLPYAVLQDNGRETWGEYGTRAWPTKYLIDKWGNVRYTHRGEGRYDETERAIQALIAEEAPPTPGR